VWLGLGLGSSVWGKVVGLGVVGWLGVGCGVWWGWSGESSGAVRGAFDGVFAAIRAPQQPASSAQDFNDAPKINVPAPTESGSVLLAAGCILAALNTPPAFNRQVLFVCKANVFI